MASSVSLPGVRIVIEMLQVSRPSGVEKTKPDLERLFYRNAVRAGFAQTVTDPCYIDRETALGHDCAGPDHGVGQYLEAVSTIPMSWVSAR